MNTLSIIIPKTDFAGQPWREKALAHVLKRIASNLPDAEVIIVAQVAQGVKALGGATLTVENDGEFCKSKLMNAGASCASGNVLLFLDADVILRWKSVLSILPKMKPGTVYKPFSTVIRLDEDQTNDAYTTGHPRKSRNQKTTNSFGGGAVLIMAEDFEKVKFCEEFTGWGYQDIDWGRRLKASFRFEEFREPAYHLFHPRDTDALLESESCRRNKALYMSRKPKSVRMTDTAMIFAYYGDNELRRSATDRALVRILELDPMPDIYFVEVGTNHFQKIMESREGCHWIGIENKPEYADLFLKESLYNKVAREHCQGYKFLIFGDPDCWTADRQWAAKTRAEITRLGPSAGVQPFSAVIDDRSGKVRRSYSSARVSNEKKCSFSPGGYWAFHSDFFFNKMHGFNAWCLPGSGDAITVIELVEDHRYPTFSTTDLPCYKKILRNNTPKIKLGTLNVEFIHCFHGDYHYNKDTGEHGRGYAGRWFIIEQFGDDAIRENCHLDENAILSWIDTGCALKAAISRKGECESKEDAIMIVEEAKRGLHLIRESDHIAALEDHYYTNHNRYGNYYVDIMAELRKLPESIKEKPILEVGSYKLPLCKNSLRMDLQDTGVEMLTIHDAGKPPYPFEDKQFSVVIASHILEHIGDKQSAAIEEFSRLADFAVIALPYLWESGTPHHLGIDEITVLEWIRGWPVISTKIGGPPSHRQIIMVIDFTGEK